MTLVAALSPLSHSLILVAAARAEAILRQALADLDIAAAAAARDGAGGGQEGAAVVGELRWIARLMQVTCEGGW